MAEDLSDPMFECYPGDDPTALAKSFASRIQPSTTTSKKETNMSLYPETITAAAAPINPVPGIGASNDPARLIHVLNRLGLVPDGQTTNLQALAQHNLPTGFSVSVYALDEKLKATGSKVYDRLAFKSSLSRAGMLTS